MSQCMENSETKISSTTTAITTKSSSIIDAGENKCLASYIANTNEDCDKTIINNNNNNNNINNNNNNININNYNLNNNNINKKSAYFNDLLSYSPADTTSDVVNNKEEDRDNLSDITLTEALTVDDCSIDNENLNVNCEKEFSDIHSEIVHEEEKQQQKLSDKSLPAENEDKQPPKSILLSSQVEPETKAKNIVFKKSVSFDTSDDTVQKFIGGEEIVDKQNPFRGTPTASITEKKTYKITKKSSRKSNSLATPPKAAPEDDFITKEEILKQSKCVATYIKNPDSYLTYDKSILERLNSTDTSDPESPVRKIIEVRKIPVPRPRNTKASPIRREESITKKKHFLKQFSSSGIKYPDLSDLKIKTGTDVDESLYDANEVAINNLKFDNRFKTAHFGSQDDLDDISDLTSEVTNESARDVNQSTTTNDSSVDDEPNTEKKSYTNTVNSKEFIEYLKKKGLSLIPQKNLGNSSTTNTTTNSSNNLSLQSNSDLYENAADMENKKRSLLNRFFKNGIFSSKSSKTTPKNEMPQPQNVFKKSSDDVRKPNLKRVTLESARPRPSSHQSWSDTDYRYRANLNSQDDDRTSSISSMLTAAEDYLDMNNSGEAPKASHEAPVKANYIDMRQKFFAPQNENENAGTRPASSSAAGNVQYSERPQYRSIDPSKSKLYRSKPIPKQAQDMRTPTVKVEDNKQDQHPITFRDKSPNIGYGVIKPKVQRYPASQMPAAQSTAGRAAADVADNAGNREVRVRQPPPVPFKRTSDRQSFNVGSPTENLAEQINRTLSMDRESIKRRSKPPKLPDRNYRIINVESRIEFQGVPAQVKITKIPVIYNENSNAVERTPPKESAKLDPKITSTPINSTDVSTASDLKNISPINNQSSSVSNATPKSGELDPYLYVKLHELKKKTDKELYNNTNAMQMNAVRKPSRTSGAHLSNQQPLSNTNYIYDRNVPQRIAKSNSHNNYDYQNVPSKLPNNVNGAGNKEIPANEAFARNSSLRSTIDGSNRMPIYGGLRTTQDLNPRVIVKNGSSNSNNYLINTNANFLDNKGSYLQSTLPSRSQSVLGDRTTSNGSVYGTINHNHNHRVSNNSTPAVERRMKDPMERDRILSQIYDFYRRSVNKTPTNLKQQPISIDAKNGEEKDTSPVAYGTVTPNRGEAGRPVVPRRVQSLAASNNAKTPIYATANPRPKQEYAEIIKKRESATPSMTGQLRRGSVQLTNDENVYGRPILISETDSVFYPSQPQPQSQPQQISRIPPQNIYDNRRIPVEGQSHQAAVKHKAPPIEPLYDQTTNEHYGTIYSQPPVKETHYGHIRGSRFYHDIQRAAPPVARPSSTVPMSEHLREQQQLHLQQQQQQQQQPHLKQYSRPLQQYIQQHQPAQQQQYIQDNLRTPTNHNSRMFVNGRSTPLILHSQPLSTPKVSYDDVIYKQQQSQPQQQQHYRPLTVRTAPRATNRNSGSQNRTIVLFNSQELLDKRDGANHVVRPKIIPKYYPYESESGSEAGEVQRILQNRRDEEDWQNDKSNRNQQSEADERRRQARREDPRRHTLGSDMLHYGGQGGGQQGGTLQRSMDLEAPPVRGYSPSNQGPLFDDDPGIMSEVETASTGFRRGGKQRSSLPVVRTPSKTLERPLGLVFLQYRSETKRALLPNEITSIDTVRALFVRSFPRQLTMIYLEGPNVKIYIHDSSKDMFYELEDVRSHLREIRDRSVLRLFESNEVGAPQVLPGGPGIPQPLPSAGGGHWDQDQSYFSEPEFDSEYQHQHIHKSSKGGGGGGGSGGGGGKNAPYYVGGTQTLPRGMYSDRNKNSVGVPTKPLRSYGSRGNIGPPYAYPPDQLYSIPDGYMSSPERGTRGAYEEPYYSQYGTRGSTVTPIIDEEQSETSLADDQYSMYGVKVPSRIARTPNQLYDPTRPEELHRIRVEHMERQLANLTGLVQKALTQQPTVPPVTPNYLGVAGQFRGVPDDIDRHSSSSSASIQDKSVSFEKSVSFSDDIQGLPKSHSPHHLVDTKPPKPAIKSSTLPRTSSQERDRLKPAPPPKPLALASAQYRTDLTLAPEVYNHLRGLQKKAKDLRTEVRTLRRLAQTQAVAVREDIKDSFMRIRATLLASSGNSWGQGDQEKTRISREEELYKQEVIRLEKDLGDLESSVEGLRGEVINRRTRVNMSAVEDMALVLSRASKTVAELKMRFPSLQQGLRSLFANEMEKLCREEKFLKDEPDRLESALKRCKKLTGTLVTLKRLASVQEQRLPCPETAAEEAAATAAAATNARPAETQTATNKPIPSPRLGTVTVSGGIAPENALDALLDELQTFAKPPIGNIEPRPDDSTSDDSSQTLQNTVTTKMSQSSLYPNDPSSTNIGLRRLHSYPSGSDTDTSPPQPPRPTGKPPVPERNADLLSKVTNKRVPPPPPPRTSSRSPLASPTSPNMPQRVASIDIPDQLATDKDQGLDSSGESVSSQDNSQRQLVLELRHQELLKKQKQLQEQYQRLQQMSKNSVPVAPNSNDTSSTLLIKKTGSESNLPQKMGLNMSVSGSMKNLSTDIILTSSDMQKNEKNLFDNLTSTATTINTTTTTTNKVYETDIL